MKICFVSMDQLNALWAATHPRERRIVADLAAANYFCSAQDVVFILSDGQESVIDYSPTMLDAIRKQTADLDSGSA